MLKHIFKLNSGEVKMVEKSIEDMKLDTLYMAFNQGGLLPIVVPLKQKKVCVEGTSCDLFR